MIRLTLVALLCALVVAEALKLDMGFGKKAPKEKKVKIKEPKDPKNAVEGEYIIAMKKGKSKKQVQSHRQVVKSKVGVQDVDMESTVFTLPDTRSYYKVKVLNRGRTKSILSNLAEFDDDIDFIEPNYKVEAAGKEIHHNINHWFLDRIDQRDLPLDNTFTTGEFSAPVEIFVVDSGINRNHTALQNRVKWSYNCIDATYTWVVPDAHGHGTAVAGLIASVSKSSSIHAIKILDENGSGTLETLLCGLDYITSRLRGEGADDTHGTKSIINLSLTTNEHSLTINEAMEQFVTNYKSIPVAAAGNNNVSACDIHPASSNHSISVGCSGQYDEYCYTTNWGSCIDILAPGKDMTVLDAFSTNGYMDYMEGTSFSTALVTGVIAEYLKKHVEMLDISDVRQWLIDMSTKNAIDFSQAPWATDTPNRLLYSPPC